MFNLGLRVDQALLPTDRPTLSTLIPFDVSHLLLGLGVAWVGRNVVQMAQTESNRIA